MANTELTLDQRLAVLLVALEESQAVSLALQEGLSTERDALREGVATQLKALEAERKKLTDELPRAIAGEARQAAEKMLSSLSQTTAKKLEEHHTPLITSLQRATDDAKGASKQAMQALEGLRGGWKTTSLHLLYTWGAVVGGAFLLALVLWLFTTWERDRERETHEALAKSTADLRVEYKKMSIEMKAWEAAGIKRIELVLCPGEAHPSLCVQVDKKAGSFGKEKDFFIPLGSSPGRY